IQFTRNASECPVDLFKDNIHKFVDTAETDTFRLYIHATCDNTTVHAIKYSFPSVLASYADSIILLDRFVNPRYRVQLTQETSYTYYYDESVIGTDAFIIPYIVMKGPKVPPGPPDTLKAI